MLRHIFYVFDSRVRGIITKLVYHCHISGKGKLMLDKNCRFIMGEGSNINIDGSLRLNDNSIINNGRSTILRVDKNGQIVIDGNASIFYGGDVIVFENGKLTIGNSFINSDCKIRCHKSIEIGDDCAISHDLTIMDSDAHALNGEVHSGDVVIGNHVWIGTHVTILNSVTVGDGAVIAAGSVVTKNVEPCSLVAGVPAKVIKNNIEWSK